MARSAGDEAFESRFARLTDLLSRLAAPAGQTAERLADHYGVSKRTIERDLNLLRSVNFPVEPLGRNRGFRLDPSFRFPAQAMTASDIVPMILGARLVGEQGHRAALSKLRNFVVNGVERQLTLELPDRVVEAGHPNSGSGWLEPIGSAIVKRCQLRISYLGTQEEAASDRIVEPLTLVVRNSVWYFQAFDHRSQTQRTFRLSRIQGCEALAVGHSHAPPSVSQRGEPFHPWDLADQPALSAVLEVTPELAAWLRENPAHPSQQVAEGKVTYQVRSPSAFLRWLLGLYGARLCQPAFLVKELVERIQALARSYPPSA